MTGKEEDGRDPTKKKNNIVRNKKKLHENGETSKTKKLNKNEPTSNSFIPLEEEVVMDSEPHDSEVISDPEINKS